ncbi:hypothetical protein QQG55_56055 [Brugia pahangi]
MVISPSQTISPFLKMSVHIWSFYFEITQIVKRDTNNVGVDLVMAVAFVSINKKIFRYIVCDNLLACYVSEMKKYMIKINTELDLFWETKVRDVIEVVSENMIYSDKIFMAYILEYNERMIKRQISYLNKYRIFAQNIGQLD